MATKKNPASAGPPAGAQLLAQQPERFRAWWEKFEGHEPEIDDYDGPFWDDLWKNAHNEWSAAGVVFDVLDGRSPHPEDLANAAPFLTSVGWRPPATLKKRPRSPGSRPPLKTGEDARAELRKLFTIALTWPNIGERRLRVYKLGLRYAASLGVMEFVATPSGIGRALGKLDGGEAIPRSTIQHDLVWLCRAGLLRKAEPGEQVSNISRKILREWSRPGSKPNVWKLPRAVDVMRTVPTDLV